MSVLQILFTIIIRPIECIIETIFKFSLLNFTSFGVAGAIIAVSLAVNFLALPIYNMADSLQEKERKIAKKLSVKVKRIKKTFTGDERFMLLQTYYREEHYHPLYALRASLSILIEIPFFIAAYHFLSNSETLIGKSFFFLSNLSAPDALITGGGGRKVKPSSLRYDTDKPYIKLHLLKRGNRSGEGSNLCSCIRLFNPSI